MPEAVLFENINFHGAHKHVFGPEPHLDAADDNFFNDRVSSIVILDGAWAFYRNPAFDGRTGLFWGLGSTTVWRPSESATTICPRFNRSRRHRPRMERR
jgi:hypothetical protein